MRKRARNTVELAEERRFPEWVRELPGALWAYELGRTVKEGRDVARAIDTYGLPASPYLPAQMRKSDTLFVLGGGSSIAGYSREMWDEIAVADSVGFNNWYLHPFVPTFYFYEGGIDHYNRTFLDNVPHLPAAFFRIPFFLSLRAHNRQILEEASPGWKRHLHLCRTAFLRARTVRELSWTYRTLLRTGAFAQGRAYRHAYTQTASLDRILHFACVAGYRRVVLCGVDLTTPGYFFDKNSSLYGSIRSRGLRVPSTDTVQRDAVHNTLSTSHARIPIDKVLQVLCREILTPLGIEVRVALSSSGLYPLFDCYFSRDANSI